MIVVTPRRPNLLSRSLRALAIAAGIACFAGRADAAEKPVTIAIEAEDFQFTGDWSPQSYKGEKIAFAGQSGAKYPAATAVQVPKAGKYRLWVRAIDFPAQSPGTRVCQVSVAGKQSAEKFGDSGKDEWTWEPGGEFELKAGPTLIALDNGKPFTRIDAVLLTNDLATEPKKKLPTTRPLALPAKGEKDPLDAAPIADVKPEAAATLQNEHVRLSFAPAQRGSRQTFVPRISLNSADKRWVDAPIDASVEAYTVVAPPGEAKLDFAGFYPRWKGDAPPLTVEAGGVTVTTLRDGGASAPWGAGKLTRFIPRTVTATGSDSVRVDFYPETVGHLTAEWQVKPAERAPRLKLHFTPKSQGQYAVGYHLFQRKPLAQTDEVLLPFMYHRHRLGQRPHTLLDPFTPTPVSLMQTTDAGSKRPYVFGVVADPSHIPFVWPHADNPHVGLLIQSPLGDVQPSVYAPVPGTKSANRNAGAPVELSCRIIVQDGDWYAGYRTAADEVYGFRDYRQNVGTSLTDAALNMIDLIMDDEHGGWWDRAKAFYQIESKNGSTHASPQILLSLYRLTGDAEIYRRRALPTIEFMLSRSGAHFSPIPQDTGWYAAGDMNGPVKLFGTTMYGGLWELSRRRLSPMLDIAFPKSGVKATTGYSHAGEFEEWLARYLLTKDKADLDRARKLADKYIDDHVRKPPTGEMDSWPFFFIQFVPSWEGLMRMYEVTGEKKYLDAAVFGARQLMTGIWTQPLYPEQVTVHPGGKFEGDELQGWKGDKEYKLGTPRKAGDAPEHVAPGWVVSNVGIGFEQPSTYKGRGKGRMILQMGWASNFLRLAAYTGDKTFETYARNAVIGRFANYPGYYYTGWTDLPLNPRYPYDGPDVTDIYYHHIAPHLAWTIDYLVADAYLHSGGKIEFPSQRQHGYAYFDARVYGHAPGKVFDEQGAWLWLKRGLVEIDNPQLNYLTAHSGSKFFLILTNQSKREQAATVRFAAEPLNFDPRAVTSVSVIGGSGAGGDVPLRDCAARVTVPPRGMTVLRLDGVTIDVPAQRTADAVAAADAIAASRGGSATAASDRPGIVAHAAAIQVDPGPWDAYVWCTATPQQAKRVTFHVAAPASSGAAWQQHVDEEYPFEFSLPVTDAEAQVRFRVTGETSQGERFETGELLIGLTAARDAARAAAAGRSESP